jgi:hypothetical protein
MVTVSAYMLPCQQWQALVHDADNAHTACWLTYRVCVCADAVAAREAKGAAAPASNALVACTAATALLVLCSIAANGRSKACYK